MKRELFAMMTSAAGVLLLVCAGGWLESGCWVKSLVAGAAGAMCGLLACWMWEADAKPAGETPALPGAALEEGGASC